MTRLGMLFFFLRFVTVLAVILLLINPSFDKVSMFIEKPNLVVAVDNSSSINHLNQREKAERFINSIAENQSLNDKFNIEFYTFGESLKASDSLSFAEEETNIYDAFKQLAQIYKQTTTPTLLISDGNQTFGNDYQFISSQYKQPVFPIILGDTVQHTDLKIQQLNVNKYAYHKNKFPVEAILVYSGNDNVRSKFEISRGNTIVHSEVVGFSKYENSKIVNLNLPASSIGLVNYKATLVPLGDEKNKVNNSRNFTVEVLNQKIKIAIVSDIIHPDLGALKKAIETNEQRSVSIFNSELKNIEINDFQSFIIYQPNNKFKYLFEQLDAESKNQFIVVGPKTDLNFLNSANKNFTFEIINQTEDYQAESNRNYTPFLVQDIGFEDFPPLYSNYSQINFFVPFETILNKTINGISTGSPLLATFEKDNRRQAVLLGENIWQWRAQSFLSQQSFNQFDGFLGKLVQYLSTDKPKSRLNIDYESVFMGGGNVVVKAEFFDKNYIFDARKSLEITVTNNSTNESKTVPFVLKNNNYQVDLSGLPPSGYSFTVRVQGENLSKSGSFQISEYNVEQQFLNADVNKLKQLAENSSGASYFIENSNQVFGDLLNDKRFAPLQKSVKKTIPLVDWKYLLAILALSLGLEWFLRKYNGLI
ncbi:VWA domain-containing protein [Tamlana crocina]